MRQTTIGLVVLLLVIGIGFIFFGKVPTTIAPTLTPPPTNVVTLAEPIKDSLITSPLHFSGQARGQWYFEGTFPVVLKDEAGTIIAQGTAAAQGEWMTEQFVPFSGDIEFEAPSNFEKGILILQKSNPSDLPENDDSLEIPIRFR
jgi:hypothetical protein